MKLGIRKLKTFLMIGAISVPVPLLFACNSVEGEINYQIIGLNKNETDYVVDISTNKQFIAHLITKNRNDLSLLNAKIKETILKQIRKVYPASYKNGEFSNVEPSVRSVSRTKFKVFFPIKRVVKNLPQLSQIEDDVKVKYGNVHNIFEKAKQDYKAKLFRPDIKTLVQGNELNDFLNKYYLPPSANDRIAKNDYVDFNYIGIAPYMAGKTTKEILTTKLGFREVQTLAAFIAKHFDGKKNFDQVQLETRLPGVFPITNFRNRKVDVFFYINNIREKDATTGEYQAKPATETFNSANDDQADLYFSLFLKRNFQYNVNSLLEIKNDKKLLETSYASLFKGLKIGKQISRIVEVSTQDDTYHFAYDNSKGHPKASLDNALASKLFTIEALAKAEGDEQLYKVNLADKYKLIATFDITKIESYNEQSQQWQAKPAGSLVALNDRITIANFKLQYFGLPFDRGNAINNKAYNGHSGFITTFDEQMEKMTTRNKKVITPIFPSDYNTPNLRSKLVRFIVKLNEVRKPKPLNNALLPQLNIKSGDGERIEVMSQLYADAVSKLKNEIYTYIINNYFEKGIEATIPFALIEVFYRQSYRDLIIKNRKRPKPEEVIENATEKAKAKAILEAFFAENGISGNDLKQKQTNLLDRLYKMLL